MKPAISVGPIHVRASPIERPIRVGTQTPSPVEDTLSATRLTSSSAVFMATVGMGVALLSSAVQPQIDVQPNDSALLLLSVLKALHLGLAIRNGMAPEQHIVEIYSRPVTVGNFVRAIVLWKEFNLSPTREGPVMIAEDYLLFAAGFSYIVYGKGWSCG